MLKNWKNTEINELREAWVRDWDRLADAAEMSNGIIRNVFERPEDFDHNRWERECRRDYENNREWLGLESLETEAM